MKISELWRYPVKSMMGESIQTTRVEANGLSGDRSYAIRDGQQIRGAKKFAQLMTYSASFDQEPGEGSIPPVTLNIGGTVIGSADASLNELLSKEIGTQVTLDKVRQASDLDYYQNPEAQPSESEIREVLGLLPDEPFPDFSAFPPEVFQYQTPPGTFFDAFPLLILTTSSMDKLQLAAPDSIIDSRRFRPNLVVDTSEFDAQYIEENWQDKFLQIGTTTIALTLACPRCVMTTIGFQDLPRDPSIMRTLVRENHHKLGIYGKVAKPGIISAGDTVTLLDSI